MSFSGHLVFAVLLTILSLPAALSAQVAPKASLKTSGGSISGRVTIKEKGVFGVAVTLRKVNTNSIERRPRAVTDQDGFYRIANVAPGTYEVSPSNPALVSADVREAKIKTVLLGEDENVDNINFTLVRGGVITGKVTDADGRPVIQQQVSIYRVEAFEQRSGQPPPQVNAAGSAPTDDRGIYRVYGLMPGRYKVATGHGDRAFNGPVRVGRSIYTQVFHPEATDELKARVIEVGEGTEATDVDISLGRALQTFTIAGRVVEGETGLPVPNVRLQVQRQVRQRMEAVTSSFVSNAQGEFVAFGLIAGTYRVFLLSNDNSGLRAEAREIEIVDQDVSGITVKLVQAASLSGVVVLETENPAVLAKLSGLQLRVFVTGANGVTSWGPSGSPIGPNGSFRLVGLSGGLANLTLASMTSPNPPKEFSIVRVELDGVVNSRGLPLSEREQLTGIRVVLAYGTATIRGLVQVENGSLPSGARIFVEIMKGGERGGNWRTIAADARGRFLIEGLPAGAYEIQAWTSNVARNMFRRVNRAINVQDGEITDIMLTLEMNPPPNP